MAWIHPLQSTSVRWVPQHYDLQRHLLHRMASEFPTLFNNAFRAGESSLAVLPSAIYSIIVPVDGYIV